MNNNGVNNNQINPNTNASINQNMANPNMSVQQIINQQSTSNQTQNNINTVQPLNRNVQDVKIIKQKSKLTPILFIFLLLLGAYTLYSNLDNKKIIENLTYNCTPISSKNEDSSLDINSTLVKDLYSKVYTTVREDVAQPEWNDTMRIYLAYRQITENKKYDSNCNLFDQNAMPSYSCEVTTDFVPKAFKQSDLEIEWKKLYGENTPLTFTNIKLDYDCIGGYQYIADRQEYVQGRCSANKASKVKATKKLESATSNGNTITLKESVTYEGTDSSEVADYLKSGYYYYNFRLDMNYNYVLVNRTYEPNYK